MTMTNVSAGESVTVRAPVEEAFRDFTEATDSWWSREHHIGGGPR